MYRPNTHSWNSYSILLVFIAYILTTSCTSTKRILYFQDLADTISNNPISLPQTTKFIDPKIESNDVLAITLQTIVQNKESNTPITTNSAGSFNSLNGFLVDKNGFIELSLIGFVKVAGLTTAEARELIKQKAKEFYKEPVVNVRIANFDIVVLGDVSKPGTVTLPSEKASVLDAIALSGDLNMTAKRNNILLIRSEGDEKKYVRFDIRSSQMFQSPYFYLKQRDIIYVEPNKYKIQNSDNTLIRNLGILSSLISLASLLVVFKSIK